MAGPYRESEVSSIDCPRCAVTLPPGSITGCVNGRGIWVTATTAAEIFDAAELNNDTIGQTGLGRAAVAPLLKRARAEADALSTRAAKPSSARTYTSRER